MRNSWKRLLAICCGVCMSVFAGFALTSCKDPEEESSSITSSEEAHVHAWDNGVVQSTSTCTTKGETLFTCTTCGETKVEYAPFQHNYEAVETVAASCTEKGYTVSRCSNCKDEIRGNYTDAVGHDYVTSVQPKTCTSHEITTYDCKNCDEDDYAEITSATTGHNTEGATWTIVSASLVDGSNCMYTLTEGATCQNAGCGETVTRTVAEPVHKANYSHTVTQEATCSQEGIITYTCSCGNSAYTYTTTFASTAHDWVEGTTENGVTTYTCSHNSAHTKQTVSATQVDEKSSQISKDALSSVASGSATEVSVTDNTTMQMDSTLLSNLASGSATEITFVAEELTQDTLPSGVDTSRLEDGATVYNFGLEDAQGNNLFTEGEMTVTVPYDLADGEDPSSVAVLWLQDDGKIESIPAIYDATAKTATFTLTHFSYYTVVRMTAEERCARDGHQNVSVTVPNDCTHGGYTLTVCGVCGKEERTNVTNPTGHNFVATTVAPTCMDKGYTRHACSNTGCQEAYVTSYVAQVPHSYVDSVVAPTCLDKGYTKHTCDYCGKSYTDNYVVPNGHTFENGACKDCGKDAPVAATANNFYFNLVQSMSEQDRLYLEVEDISFTANVEMEDMTANVSSEVTVYRMAFKVDENGYIVGQGEGKVKTTMEQIEDGDSMTQVMEMEVILVFQNGKIYTFEKAALSQNGQANNEAVYSMVPQDEVEMDDVKAMYEQVFGDSISNIVNGMMATENNPLNTAMASVLEYVFTKTETANGYTFTVNYDALPGIYDALTEKTVAQAFDGVFGEGSYVKTYNYIYSLPEKTVEQFRNDIVAWCMKCGVDIKDVYAALDALINNMPTGGMGGGVEDSPNEGQDSGAIKPTSTTEEPETISVEEILTQMKDMTIAQVIDAMTGAEEPGLENYKAMIAQMGDPEEGMLAVMSVSEIALGMGVGENEEMLEMITGIMAYVEEQLTNLATSLEGTASMGFTTDKQGNLLTLEANFDEFAHELTIDGAIVAILSGGDMETDIDVSITADGKANVVMGGSYIANYDHIVSALEKSMSVFNITETIELTKKEYYYIDKENSIKIFYEREYVLVPTEKGVLYAPAYAGTNMSEHFDTQEDTYQGQACTSYKVRVWGGTPMLLVPEQGISFADSCSGWKEYSSQAYYCHNGAVYKVYKAGTEVKGVELCVEDTTMDVGYGDAHETMSFYYNAGLKQYSLNDPHNWVMTEVKQPEGCEDRGYRAYRCSVCGESMVETWYNGHDTEHSYKLVDGATSCADGLKDVYTCTECGEVTYERNIPAEEAAYHPTMWSKEALPGATASTCPEHYVSTYKCACGQREEMAHVGHYDGEGNFSQIGHIYNSENKENGNEQWYYIYRCAVNGCGYTYAREVKRTYDTANCTLTEEQNLYAGITYNDAEDTITDFGTKYAYSSTDDWHPTMEGPSTVEGNIVTSTHVCQNCNKTIILNKYEKLYYGTGEYDCVTRELRWFDYIDENGYDVEYDEYCNTIRYQLNLVDGQLVRSEGYKDGTQHSYHATTVKESTCSQFGEELRVCAACNDSRTVKAVRFEGHSFGYDGELNAYVCWECGLVSETGSSGAFVLENMTENGEVKVGYMNKYNRYYTIRVFVNYDADMKTGIDLTSYAALESLISQTKTERTESDIEDYGYYWTRECGIVTLNMDTIMSIIETQNLDVETLSVIFETEYNYEAEGEYGEYYGAFEYGIHFEIGKAGTYVIDTSVHTDMNANDYVITLNANFTYTITSESGLSVFEESGNWEVYGDAIRLYNADGNYALFDANLSFADYGSANELQMVEVA